LNTANLDPAAPKNHAELNGASTGSPAWTTEDAKELYLIDRWGGGYFDVNESGNMTIAPLQERGKKIDIREGGNPKGTEWTGFHRIERELWKNNDVAAAAKFADRLDADVATLRKTLTSTKVAPEQLANGARQLMDEVATGKITGEEERYSRTDLDDFQANLEGAKAAYTSLRPVVAKRNPALATRVDERFERTEDTLAKYRAGDGFVTYDTLTKSDTRALASVVDGLSESLSRVSGVVLR